MSVSEVLEARAAGKTAGGVAVAGYWTDRSRPWACSAGQAGELELRCVDGEFGITELAEPIVSVARDGSPSAARGPHLSPWFEADAKGAEDLFSLPVVNGQQFPPVAITVVGHFDDPRVAECRSEARRLCADRLVVTRIVAFPWRTVETPAPTPSPTPFPSPAPSGIFDPTTPDICAGDVKYSFVGWTTTDELGLSFHRDGHVWAAITQDVVPLGGWTNDPQGGKSYRVWGQRICLATEADPNVVLYSSVAETAYREFADGFTEPIDLP